MDPLACILKLDQAISDCDWPEAVAAINDYYQWRIHGGGMPRFLPADSIRGLLLGDDIVGRCATLLADKLSQLGDS